MSFSVNVALAELDKCMEALLTSVAQQSPQDSQHTDPLPRCYETATKLKEHLLEIRREVAEDTATSLRCEIEALKDELKEKDALLEKYAAFVEKWNASMDELKLKHRVNMNDFRKGQA